MALNLNHVVVAGHLTRDPQVKVVASDRAVADFGLAVNRRFKGADGETKEESTFFDVEAWGRTAEIVGQYLAKGSPVYVEGRMRIENWQDKDGNRRTKVKIVAENVQFISRREGARGDAGEPHPRTAVAAGAAKHDAQTEAEAVSAKEEPPF